MTRQNKAVVKMLTDVWTVLKYSRYIGKNGKDADSIDLTLYSTTGTIAPS